MSKAVNKVVYDGDTLIDLTDLTVDQDKLLRGYTARRADGNKVTGTMDQTITYVDGHGDMSLDENDYLQYDDSGSGGGSTPGSEFLWANTNVDIITIGANSITNTQACKNYFSSYSYDAIILLSPITTANQILEIHGSSAIVRYRNNTWQPTTVGTNYDGKLVEGSQYLLLKI